ncbi:MAG: hypothetical protein KDA24_12705 [Deltaproteobacteria bacterium]|nr:hypothetical protein [Deltaproteobacteria bacterium]
MGYRVKQATSLLLFLFWLMPQTAFPDEMDARLQRVLSEAAAASGNLVTLDRSAHEAARAYSMAALDGTASPLVHRQALWDAGVRDVHSHPITVVAGAIPPDSALTMLIAGAGVDWARTRHAGVGWARSGDRVAATFLLLERNAAFEGKVVQLAPSISAARVIVTNPLGQVGRRELLPAGRQGAFLRDEERQLIAGTWLFELEGDLEGQARLLALWTAEGGSGETSGPSDGGDTLGLGPAGLGSSEEVMTVGGGLDWMIGASEPPDRVPFTRDAEAVEKHLRKILKGRRRAAKQPKLEVHVAATRVARERSLAEVQGTGELRPPHARLLEAGVTPLAAEEVVVVAQDPITGWALLLAEPSARDLILRAGVAHYGLGVAVVSHGPHWSVGLTLLRAEVGGPDATWRTVVQEHIRRARSDADLGDLYAREPLHSIAEAAAEEVARRGVAQMPAEERAKLVERTREVVPDSTSVGVEVLVVRDPGAVAGREHVVDPRFAEVGVGVVEVPDSDAGFAIVLVLVQR